MSGPATLSELIRDHRDEIIARCRARVTERMAPRARRSELEHGIPLFLHELELTLARAPGHRPGAATAAVQHGRDLLSRGFTIAQVVHDYGDVCQTISELAIERAAPLSTEEFRLLNECLDGAIAEAVTEYMRQRELDAAAERTRRSNEQLGSFADGLDGLLGSAMLAFGVLRAGSVGIAGSTGDVLGRSLVGLRDLVDRSLTQVRLAAGISRCERIAVARFVEDVEVAAVLGARARGIRLTVAEVDPKLAVDADRQILSSVVSTLLHNAFRYTRPHTHVWLHAHATEDRVLFEVEDQCGGIAPRELEQLTAPFRTPSDDRAELGPGLAICVRGMAALGGAFRVRNRNNGCVFTAELPRSPD